MLLSTDYSTSELLIEALLAGDADIYTLPYRKYTAIDPKTFEVTTWGACSNVKTL